MLRVITSSLERNAQPFQCNADDLKELLKAIEELAELDIDVVDLKNGKAEVQVGKMFYTIG